MAAPGVLPFAAPPRPATRHNPKLPLSGLGSGSAKSCGYILFAVDMTVAAGQYRSYKAEFRSRPGYGNKKTDTGDFEREYARFPENVA